MTPERVYGVSKNFRTVGRIDVSGGGQVTVEGGCAYIGHMSGPEGTTLLDVSDPRRPRVVSHLTVPPSIHSHKVRVAGDVMLVNYERMRDATQPAQGGLKVFDISDRSKPREIAFFKTGGTGVHRFDFDGRYCYFSPEVDGYLGNIVMILDVSDPERPEEVSRWWLPGQHVAGGETPGWEGRRCRCHHPLRLGNRLYVSYWHAGFVVLDIGDLRAPKLVSRLDWSPPYPCPTHTALPVPHEIRGRRFLVATDEEVPDRLADKPNAFFWVVDITDETEPVPVSTTRSRIPTLSTTRPSSAPTSRRSKSTGASMTTFSSWPGSPGGCGPWISATLTVLGRWATTCPLQERGRNAQRPTTSSWRRTVLSTPSIA